MGNQSSTMNKGMNLTQLNQILYEQKRVTLKNKNWIGKNVPLKIELPQGLPKTLDDLKAKRQEVSNLLKTVPYTHLLKIYDLAKNIESSLMNEYIKYIDFQRLYLRHNANVNRISGKKIKSEQINKMIEHIKSKVVTGIMPRLVLIKELLSIIREQQNERMNNVAKAAAGFNSQISNKNKYSNYKKFIKTSLKDTSKNKTKNG
tara:strand:+ start:2795 stop:3403 length:609 start_codon:yes stop_codon:yes gene_type:complete